MRRRGINVSDSVMNIENLGAFLASGSAYLVARTNGDETELQFEICNGGTLNYRLQEYFNGNNIIRDISVYRIDPNRQNRLHHYLLWISPPKLRRRHRENQSKNA